jgi:hypothetical protein
MDTLWDITTTCFLFTEDEEQTLGFNHEHEYGRTYLGELYNDLTAMSQRSNDA